MKHILEFLTDLYKSGLSYSAINTARSTLSSIFSIIGNIEIGSDKFIKRFMKGIFHLRPAIKRNFTWDLSRVLDYLKSLPSYDEIQLKDLAHKLVMLLALLSGQRAQSLHLIDINHLEINVAENTLKIQIHEPIKTTRPGFHQAELALKGYSKDRNLCVLTALQCYIEKTKLFRKNETKLFISCVKPHRKVTRDTIRNWVKTVLLKAGIDMKIFTGHSTRSASTSAVCGKIPLQTILRTAGWSRESTFRQFYDKQITVDTTYSEAVLDHYCQK